MNQYTPDNVWLDPEDGVAWPCPTDADIKDFKLHKYIRADLIIKAQDILESSKMGNDEALYFALKALRGALGAQL